MAHYNVIVVGSGNAGFSAALACREAGASVLLVEKGPADWAGGNTYFTAGAMRISHQGLDDLACVLSGTSPDLLSRTDLPPYPETSFISDLHRVTRGKADPDLVAPLVAESRDAIDWLAAAGMRFELMYHRQAYEVDGRLRFWGGLALGVVGGGKGMIDQHLRIAREHGVALRFDTAAHRLRTDSTGAVNGVLVRSGRHFEEITADAVVLTSGGFEASAQMRSAHLGPGWDLALVRGTPFNTGDGIRMAVDIGAQTCGHWSGCHSVAWDAEAGPTGDRTMTNQLTRGGYPFGIVVNSLGQRFLDEGADFRNYTYARYGAEILRQPGSIAYQIFDAKVAPLLREAEYAAPATTRAEAGSIAELAAKIGVGEKSLSSTVNEFNQSVDDAAFDPTIKDGKKTRGPQPPKSNWAQPIDTPPFLAFPVTCGITFTFGGLRIDPSGSVLDTGNRPIPGLFAAGELVGGLFYFNYPGGSGLTAGTVFGRRAGTTAARSC